MKYLLLLPFWLSAMHFEIPCTFIYDTATHEEYIIVDEHRYDIWEMTHSEECQCQAGLHD